MTDTYTDTKTATDKLTVLFVSRADDACGLMAAAMIARSGLKRLRAFSAGIRPADTVDPAAVNSLLAAQVPVEGLWPKGLDGFAGERGPRIDLVVTLSDAASDALADSGVGRLPRVHWPVEDGISGRIFAESRRHDMDRARRRLAVMVDDLLGTVSARAGDPPACLANRVVEEMGSLTGSAPDHEGHVRERAVV